MFPFSIEGTFELLSLTSDNPEELLCRIEGELVRADATEICRNETRIIFRGGTRRVFFRTLRVPIKWEDEPGAIEFVPGPPAQVRFRYSLVPYFLSLCIFSMVFGAVAVCIPKFNVWLIGVFAGWCIFVMNYVFVTLRLRYFIKRAIQGRA